MKKFFDTNEILNNCDDLSNVVLSSKTIEELENIKTSANKDDDIKYKARMAVRAINEFQTEVVVATQSDIDIIKDVFNLEVTNDNIIIACAYRYNKDIEPICFYTEDYLCKLIAKDIFNLRVESYGEKPTSLNYIGYKIVSPTDEELAKVYDKDNKDNLFKCEVNEYVLMKGEDGDCIDVLKWSGQGYSALYNKPFKSRQYGNIKPLDSQQKMAFDSIASNDLTILFGRSGSGKTTIPLSYITQQLENGKCGKCYIVYSFDTLKGQKTLGYVKGDQTEKLLSTGSLGGILATKFGDMTEVERLLASGQIEIIPTANLRGQEFGSDSICFCTEAQNLDRYALRTLLQRCKSGCKIILEGDIIEQCDTARGVGLFKALDVYKGYHRFGCVKLKNNYRDEIGELADKI